VRCRQLSGDAFLLGFELAQRYRAGIVRLEQLVTLGAQLGDGPGSPLDLAVALGSTSSRGIDAPFPRP
jgi:hypothetical protein